VEKFIRELPRVATSVNIPGNLDTREGKEALPIIKSMIPWTEKVYDMTDEQLKEYKSAYYDEYHNSEEKNNREVIDVFYMEYQYYQVRKDWNWVLDQYKLSGDKMAIRREILMQRLRGSTNSPISPEDIEYLTSNMKHPIKDLLINNKWLFRIYEHGAKIAYGNQSGLDPSIPYLVGIDPAGGGGGDNFAITIVNPYNLRIAAEFKNPYLSGPHAVRMLVELVKEYIPRAVLCIEKNSMGIYLIQMLAESDIRDAMYWSDKAGKELENVTQDEPGLRELREMSAETQKYGTFCSGPVRKAMIELLFQHIDQCKQLLCTEYLVDDLCKLVRTSTGRIEASKGEHDDCMMSYLHAIYIYYTGDNLAAFGIERIEHPVWGNVGVEEDTTQAQPAVPFTFDENGKIADQPMDWDQQVMQDSLRVEDQIQTMVNQLSFVRSAGFKRKGNSYGLNNDTVDIPMSFFDQINGV